MPSIAGSHTTSRIGSDDGVSGKILFVYMQRVCNVRVHACVGVCTHLWRPQVDVGCLFANILHLAFVRPSFTEAGAYCFSKAGWPAGPRILLSVSPVLGFQACTSASGLKKKKKTMGDGNGM